MCTYGVQRDYPFGYMIIPLTGILCPHEKKGFHMNERILTSYNDIQTKMVNWLWYPYIAFGKITLIQGDPGDGKSSMMMNIIAAISKGDKTPDGNVVQEPIQAYLGNESDLQIAGRARKLLRRLSMWAECYNCAIVLIGHMNKRESGKGMVSDTL